MLVGLRRASLAASGIWGGTGRPVCRVATRCSDAWWMRAGLRQLLSASTGSSSELHGVWPLHPGALRPAPDFNAPLEEFASYG
jgi:hypothetical protein